MTNFLKTVFVLLLSIAIGVIISYIIGVLITGGERNIFQWPLWGRIMFAIVSFIASSLLFDSYKNDEKV